VLGVAVEEGRIESVDARLEDCYPEALQVLPGEGPKPGRHARRKDRAITLRQLISNTSGYLKPDEAPGEVFHYQTWGMNVLEHAVASTYGLYDVDAPEDNEFERLLTTRLRAPLQGEWEYDLKNFQEHENDHARLEIFGYYTNVFAHALDLARIGWLWRNWGEWGNHRLVPEWWLREATSTVSTVSRPESGGTWEFGQGFWTNSGREMWPDLPADAFAASGMEGGPGSDPDHPIVFSHVWVCPSLDLVVAMSPSPYEHPSTIDRPGGLIERVVAAVEA
jgi:CubicO group peptidase (beta-lactamase class C family)